jgi:acetyltransferase-like isoleucine patch superfamily enzyme
MIRTYSELLKFQTFEERFEYLVLGGSVGHSTFGFDRYVNQNFYRSHEWKTARNYVIARDFGCDLGVEGFEIHSGILVHHINPMGLDDLTHGEDWVIDPDFLITTTLDTHNAIHYGDARQLRKPYVERSSGDTKLW